MTKNKISLHLHQKNERSFFHLHSKQDRIYVFNLNVLLTIFPFDKALAMSNRRRSTNRKISMMKKRNLNVLLKAVAMKKE